MREKLYPGGAFEEPKELASRAEEILHENDMGD